MKILHVTRQFLPSTGGLQQAVYQLARHQRSDGLEAAVLTLNRSFADPAQVLAANEVIDGIPVHRIPYRGSSRYALAPSVLSWASAYDLLHLHSSDFFLDYLAATRFWHGVPMVMTSHGLFFHTPFARRLKQLYFSRVTRWSLRNVNAVICVSEQDYAMLNAIAPAEKLHCIPNGIDYAKLSAYDASQRDEDLLLAIGGLSHRKRYDRLLRAFAATARRRPAVRLVIVGADLGMRAELTALAHALDIDNRMSFAGEVNEETLDHYLQRASVFLGASEYEAFGIAAVEAAVAGCIPVLQPLPPYQQLFGSTTGVRIVDYDDTVAAGRQIEAALDLSAATREQIVNGHRLRFRPYAWTQISTQTAEIYRSVIDARTVTKARTEAVPKK